MCTLIADRRCSAWTTGGSFAFHCMYQHMLWHRACSMNKRALSIRHAPSAQMHRQRRRGPFEAEFETVDLGEVWPAHLSTSYGLPLPLPRCTTQVGLPCSKHSLHSHCRGVTSQISHYVGRCERCSRGVRNSLIAGEPHIHLQNHGRRLFAITVHDVVLPEVGATWKQASMDLAIVAI